VAVPGRLELPTCGLGNRRSIQLSYGTGRLYLAQEKQAQYDPASPSNRRYAAFTRLPRAIFFWASNSCSFAAARAVARLRYHPDRRHHPEDRPMPTTVTLYLIGVWFCVGFFTGAGWAIAAWLVGRISSRLL
jgi:hypothetical protein